MAQFRPSAKRPRVENLDDSFEDPRAENIGGELNESFDDDGPSFLATQPNVANQPSQVFPQSQYQSQLADIGQMIMLKKQKENAQVALMKLEKEKAAREYEFNRQKRELEDKKNIEIKNLREELGSLKREYTMMTFRQTSHNMDTTTIDSQNTSTYQSSASVLPTKKVEFGRPSGFQNRYASINNSKPNPNHSIFKHPNTNFNETFAPLSTQRIPRASTPILSDSEKQFNFPERETCSKSIQADQKDLVYELTVSEREAKLEQIIEASLNISADKFSYEEFLNFCEKVRGQPAETFLDFPEEVIVPEDEEIDEKSSILDEEKGNRSC